MQGIQSRTRGWMRGDGGVLVDAGWFMGRREWRAPATFDEHPRRRALNEEDAGAGADLCPSGVDPALLVAL